MPSCPDRLYHVPVTLRKKSTPVTVNGSASSTLTASNGGGSGAEYGLPTSLLHGTHFLSKCYTHRLIAGIQYF
ncbi:hypothetical protein DPMN_166815 [Dreissena polymorpha]|uniref:Uncharacterized protein n=1 Tax=Dreissena polymorpha TaxID=45954 RepID=A0A9D4F089_DREPO|nr:hypothetical protein DPMN_166815 [Dreissena polymorpha]